MYNKFLLFAFLTLAISLFVYAFSFDNKEIYILRVNHICVCFSFLIESGMDKNVFIAVNGGVRRQNATKKLSELKVYWTNWLRWEKMKSKPGKRQETIRYGPFFCVCVFLWLPRHFHQKQYDIYIMTLVVCICISFPQERKATQRYSQNQKKKNVKYAQWTNNRIIFFSHLQTSSETKRIKQQTKRERKPLTNEEFLISLKKQEKRYMTIAVFGRKHNEQFALLSHGNIIYREMRVR